jgi:phosphoglycerol transferase MdoB-like AlkP superfamily enzyme
VKPVGRFKPLIVLLGLFLVLSTATRVILLFQAWTELDAGPRLLAMIFATGFFFDCVTFSYFAIPFAVVLSLLPDRARRSRYMRPFTYAAFLATTYFLLFDAAAEYFFFEEFGTRFNFIAVDYLVYTTELVRNIRESYPLPGILGALLALDVVLILAIRTFIDGSIGASDAPTPPPGIRRRVTHVAALAALPVLSFAFVTVSMTGISANNFANELAGNGIYDFGAAFRNNELDFDRFYATRETPRVLAGLRELLREPHGRYRNDDPADITRDIRRDGAEKRLNVIVIVEESLSAEFLGAFGNRQGLTPNLDRLAGESLLFTRLIATGTRTVRGLEAIDLSIPPLPGASVVKRPKNEEFFSWGSLMREKGYDTKFIYAGYGYFDDMNHFFANNGFDVVDRTDFAAEEITFANVWGVCDEDLFARTVLEAGKSHAAGRPFFSMVMTTSNHRPFTYPGGKIDIPSHTGREGAVKYADYAIGRLLDRAGKEKWFHDTLFVILADHCAGSAGKTALPVKKYEIPMMVYAPSHVRPRRVDRLASQIDVAPTVLGLLNASYRTKFFGRDILAPGPPRERAFLSTYQKLGYMDGDRLVVLEPVKKVESYAYRREDGLLTPASDTNRQVEETLAYYQGANIMYKSRFR